MNSIYIIAFLIIGTVNSRNNSYGPLRAPFKPPILGLNQGVYYGQPEQIALSYSGMQLLKYFEILYISHKIIV